MARIESENRHTTDENSFAIHASLAEIIKILSLEQAQIRQAKNDNDRAMSELIDAHSILISQLQAQKSPGSTNQALEEMIVAFQGHDALNQRLEHVVETLQTLVQLLNKTDVLSNPEALQDYEKQLRKKYTMESERQIYDEIFNKESLRTTQNTPSSQGGSIELF